ncbi:hypothetical protein [Polaromonas sp. AER18D-145]|uniref:hypothetical protein n=1 Tax=Polaromonas sp. AER18D-145 TaxID=1977060 RepID=UPI00114375BD|nr:hypothetical protein [Polaromonas sp. AER18D-145]
MPIEFFQVDDGTLIRQSFDSPTVYLDHWAIRFFSENIVSQDRLVNALMSTGGTLLLSNISFAEFAGPIDPGHSRDAGAFVERLLPNIYFTDFAFDKILERERLEANNERRFWPSADVRQLKLFAECALDGALNVGIKRLFEMAYLSGVAVGNLSESLINIIREALETARNDPAHVRKAKNLALSDGRPRTTMIMGELMRGFNLDGNSSFSNNDVMDFLHAVMPVNSCDYVLLDGPWVDRVNKMSQRMAKAGMTMPIAKCFSKGKNGGIEAFLASLETFTSPESRAVA